MNINTRKFSSVKAKRLAVRIITPIVRWVFLISISYVLLYPLIYMLSASFRSFADFTDPTVMWVPKNFTIESFKAIWSVIDYPKALLNTVIYEMISALIEVMTCAITAYGLARFEFKGKNILTFVLLLTILIPTEMIIIPLMTSMKSVDVFGILNLIGKLMGTDIRPNLLNTPLAFYIPSLLSVGLKSGLFIYMYVQFFKGLPKELEEAASIDGAGPIKTFLTIVVPSSGTIFLTVTIFSVIWHWNDQILASMYLAKSHTLSVKLSLLTSLILDRGNPDIAGRLMASCLLCILPPLILYCILQKQFIKSIDRVGIVG